MNKNFCFMAFGKGVESVESVSFKKYIGVAPVYIKAVNPNKKELEDIYNTNIENEPNYISNDPTGAAQIRVDFVVSTVEEACGVNMTTKIPFFIKKSYRFNKDQTKVQVIDKYGRTCWVTKEQCKNHEIPIYSNGPANIDKDYRPCYIGEEALTNFIKVYLGIPNVMKYVNNTWVMVEHPENSEARLENIDKLFTGDISAIKEAISYRPTNKIKVLFGVRTTDEGKEYQVAFSEMFLSNNTNKYEKLEKELNARKEAGAYSTTEFAICNIKEYTVAPTSFETPAEVETPFSNSSNTMDELPW